MKKFFNNQLEDLEKELIRNIVTRKFTMPTRVYPGILKKWYSNSLNIETTVFSHSGAHLLFNDKSPMCYSKKASPGWDPNVPWYSE